MRYGEWNLLVPGKGNSCYFHFFTSHPTQLCCLVDSKVSRLLLVTRQGWSTITSTSRIRARGDEDEEVQSDADSERSSLKFFNRCTVNMVSVDEPEEDDEEDEVYEFAEEETEQESNPIPPTEDEVREHNLGTAENPRPIFLSALLGEEERAEYMRLLQEFSDVFAWSYAEMPGLDPEVAMHRLNIREDAKPVKQPQRKFHPAIMEKIEKEVQKLTLQRLLHP